MTTCPKGCGRPARIRGMCNSHYQAYRTKRLRAGVWQRPVPAIGITRRLQALVAIGYSQEHLCRLVGLTSSHMSHLIRGAVERTNFDTAARILAAYERLSMTLGPSRAASDRAHRKGWAPPLAWDEDEIDNPQAHPDKGQRVKPKFVERYTELRDLGYSDFDILRKWQMRPESLLRQMHRYGITPNPELVTIVSEIKRQKVAS